MEDLSRSIYIQILKKGLNIQEVLEVLDEVKTLVEVGVNFKNCQHCGKELTNHI